MLVKWRKNGRWNTASIAYSRCGDCFSHPVSIPTVHVPVPARMRVEPLSRSSSQITRNQHVTYHLDTTGNPNLYLRSQIKGKLVMHRGHNKGYRIANRLLTLLATTAVCGAANAQENNQGDIVVTAQKRQQTAQSVGISMQAFGAEELTSRGVSNASQLVNITPGLSTSGAFAGDTLAFGIRGVVQQDFGGQSESPVATYVDDSYVASASVAGIGLFDVERVEVLKGPQGTLFGRNATGGVVNIFTREPTSSANGFVKADYGSHDSMRLEAATGGPISDTLSFRVAGLFDRNGAWVKNKNAQGDDLGNKEQAVLRLRLAYKPTAHLSLLLTGFIARQTSSWAPYFSQAVAPILNNAGDVVDSTIVSGDTFFGPPSDIKNLTIDSESARSSGGRKSASGVTLKTTWDFGPTLTSITDVKTARSRQAIDDEVSPTYFLNSISQDFAKSLSQELRLSGTAPQLRWFTGAYYLHIKSGTNPADLIVAPADLITRDEYNLRTNSYSAFGQVEYDLSSRLTLIAGGRVTLERKAFDYQSTNLTLAEVVVGPARTPYSGNMSDTLYSAKAQIEYKPSQDVLIYAGFNRGVKAGSFNAPLAGGTSYPDSDIPYAPETLNAYEIGVKSDLFDRLLRLNASTFYYDYDDYQAFKVIGLSTQVSNNRSKIYGGELDATLRPIDGLTLRGWASYTHDRVYDVSISGQPTLLTRVAPNTSKWKAGALARYETDLAGGSLSFQGDLNYTSRFWFSLTNYSATEVKKYALLGLGLGWDKGDWSILGQVSNLTDKRYKTVGFDLNAFCGCSQVGIGQPRWFRLSITRNF
ncbi:TonB-dependent receptor [Sphingobium sp. AP50]|uniref:TonB-dependent receptor n=1 Tax=Sphingobium sp. AP50 TaxID=1884369 RepID=UPI0011600E45|nr:TonB-dependent receptor [Sphingobium sp. AP50]